MVDVKELNNENTKWEKVNLDIGWYPIIIRYRLVNTACMEFEVYRDESYEGNLTNKLYIDGFLRFDNCINWKFKDDYAHFCDLKGVKSLYSILEFIYKLGEKTIPSWLYYNENS